MKHQSSVIELRIRGCVSPESTCRVESAARNIPHVMESSFDPVNNLLTVKVHEGMATDENIIEELKQRGIVAEKRRPVQEEYDLEHEVSAARKISMHDHHAMMERELKNRFLVAAIFTVPVLILSPSIQTWFGYSLPSFAGRGILLFAAASIVVLWGGLIFYKGSVVAIRMHTLDMNVLVSIALSTGYLYSVGATFLFAAADFYWEISTLATFILFGHWMEMKAERTATSALKELVKLIPPIANLVKNGETVSVPTANLKVGDVVLVKPGEKVPIDGVVVDGETSVNEAMVTGESKPTEKEEGSKVIGGTINVEGAIRISVTRTGDETAVAQIVKLVQQSMTTKPQVQRLADRAAFYLTVIAIFVGVGTFLFWFSVRVDLLFALSMAITVIVITCPHALGLAIPAVTAISTTLAANKGILIKNAKALQVTRNVDIVVFDKTGTLTKGEFGVTDIVELGSWGKREIMETAVAVEANSEHVIAKAIVAGAKAESHLNWKADKFAAIPGKGVTAMVGGRKVYLGNAVLMKDLKFALERYEATVREFSSEGKTVVYIATENSLEGLIALSDLTRDESREAVKQLKQFGLEVAMLTGDNKQTAAYVAKQLNLDMFFAEVLPEEKASTIRGLQDQGKRVAMVGDGVNDAPALVQSDVGIAIGAGTDVAVESADVVLVKNDPRDVARLVRLSKKTMQKMNQNLVWATGYNVIAIPAAAGVFVPLGIVLRPEFAAIAMSVSSISVTVNALLLRTANL